MSEVFSCFGRSCCFVLFVVSFVVCVVGVLLWQCVGFSGQFQSCPIFIYETYILILIAMQDTGKQTHPEKAQKSPSVALLLLYCWTGQRFKDNSCIIKEITIFVAVQTFFSSKWWSSVFCSVSLDRFYSPGQEPRVPLTSLRCGNTLTTFITLCRIRKRISWSHFLIWTVQGQIYLKAKVKTLLYANENCLFFPFFLKFILRIWLFIYHFC